MTELQLVYQLQRSSEVRLGPKVNQITPPPPCWSHPRHRLVPFGVEFKDLVPVVAFIGAGQTNPSRLCGAGSAGAAGKHCLPLHITLMNTKQSPSWWRFSKQNHHKSILATMQTQKHEKMRTVSVYVWPKQQRRRGAGGFPYPRVGAVFCIASSQHAQGLLQLLVGDLVCLRVRPVRCHVSVRGENTVNQLGLSGWTTLLTNSCCSCGGSLSRDRVEEVTSRYFAYKQQTAAGVIHLFLSLYIVVVVFVQHIFPIN